MGVDGIEKIVGLFRSNPTLGIDGTRDIVGSMGAAEGSMITMSASSSSTIDATLIDISSASARTGTS